MQYWITLQYSSLTWHSSICNTEWHYNSLTWHSYICNTDWHYNSWTWHNLNYKNFTYKLYDQQSFDIQRNRLTLNNADGMPETTVVEGWQVRPVLGAGQKNKHFVTNSGNFLSFWIQHGRKKHPIRKTGRTVKQIFLKFELKILIFQKNPIGVSSFCLQCDIFTHQIKSCYQKSTGSPSKMYSKYDNMIPSSIVTIDKWYS